MKKINFFVLALFLIIGNGCNKDEAVDFKATKMKLEEKLEKLDVPEIMKNSSNPNAQMAVGYVEQVKGVSGYFSFFGVPEDATNTNTKSTMGDDEYYWNYGGMEIWESYSETSNSIIWEIDVNMGNGRLKYLYAEEDKDGNYGFWEVYGYSNEVSDYIFRYEWSFDNAGNATLIWKAADNSFEYEINSNVDYTGGANWYTYNNLNYAFLWNKDGSGSYSYYDDNGDEIMADSWSAADL